MLKRIVDKVQLIEKSINTVAVEQKTVEEERQGAQRNLLRYIVELLKQTYQVLPGERIAAALSLPHIVEILRMVNDVSYPDPSVLTPYTQLLKDIYQWSDKDCRVSYTYLADEQTAMQVVLPINQDVDERSGNGQCAGYLQKWTDDMYLYNQWIIKNSRGLSVRDEMKEMKITVSENNFPSVLNKIPYHGIADSHFPPLPSISEKYLTHVAPVTDEIRNLHRLQDKFWLMKNPVLHAETVRSMQLFSSVKNLTDELIATADTRMGEVVRIWFLRKLSLAGHVVGLMKTNDHCYHFFDANHNYSRFRQADDFRRWFPKYYHGLGYDFQRSVISILRPYHNAMLPNNKSYLRRCADMAATLAFILIAVPMAAAFIVPLLVVFLIKLYQLPTYMRNAAEAERALDAEKTAVQKDIRHCSYVKIAKHISSPTYYKSQRFFSDDVLLKPQVSSQPKKKISSFDDTAVLPRFFSPGASDLAKLHDDGFSKDAIRQFLTIQR